MLAIPLQIVSEENVLGSEYPIVLVVDDSTVCQNMIRKLLEKSKFRTDGANNGLQAIAKVRDNPGKFDAILMDIRMPLMNGIVATQTLREDYNYEGPIIALSASTDVQIIYNIIAAGANEAATKPLRYVQILSLLAKYGVTVDD